MSLYTREQFEEYKDNDEFLEVFYYSQPDANGHIFWDVAYHYTYEEYVIFFKKFYGKSE